MLLNLTWFKVSATSETIARLVKSFVDEDTKVAVVGAAGFVGRGVNPETRRRSVEKMRQVCRQLDALNLLADEAIAPAEVDIRNSPLTAYRLGRAKR